MSSPLGALVAVFEPDGAVRDSLISLLTAAGIPAQGFDSIEEFLAGTDPNVVGCVTGNIGSGAGPGLRLLTAARSRGRAIPVILFSADLRPMVRRQAMNAGAAVILTRPANPGEFIRQVRRLLGL